MHLNSSGGLMRFSGRFIQFVQSRYANIYAIDSSLRINPMNTAIIIIGSIAAIVGVGVATWSIISTRKKYYDEYMKRKRRAGD